MIRGLTAERTIKDENVQAAREHTGKGFSFTRRTIAISSILAVVVLPLVAGAIFPGMPVNYGFQEVQGGFLFFTEAKDVMKFVTSYGITILPFMEHLVAAIAGLYFGSSVAK